MFISVTNLTALALSYIASKTFCVWIVLLLHFRLFHLLNKIRAHQRSNHSCKNVDFQQFQGRTKGFKTLAVLGSGGHTTEMLELLSSVTDYKLFRPLFFVVSNSDTTSINRLKSIYEKDPAHEVATNRADNNDVKPPTKNKLSSHEKIFKIPRAREVGQSYITSIFTTIKSILYTSNVVIQTRPDLVILNGPGTCLPVAFWAFCLRFFGFCEGKIVFCESFCRVTSLSLTGKILMKLGIVDLFLVHWEELVQSVHRNSADGNKCLLIDSFIQHY